MKSVAIVQARMGGTRLPAKVLADIAGEPMVQRVLERVDRSSVDDIRLAIPTGEPNDPLMAFAQEHGWRVHRGPEQDVLTRIHDAAKRAKAEVIVRVTADCPCIDPGEIDTVIQYRQAGDWAYACNRRDGGVFTGTPDGMDVEVFTWEALEQAHKSAEEREQPTQWMAENLPVGTLIEVAPDVRRVSEQYKFSVDGEDDLTFVRSVYEALGAHFELQDIVEWLSSQTA